MIFIFLYFYLFFAVLFFSLSHSPSLGPGLVCLGGIFVWKRPANWSINSLPLINIFRKHPHGWELILTFLVCCTSSMDLDLFFMSFCGEVLVGHWTETEGNNWDTAGKVGILYDYLKHLSGLLVHGWQVCQRFSDCCAAIRQERRWFFWKGSNLVLLF